MRKENTICIIQVLPSERPLFVHENGKKEFYVRSVVPRAEHLDGKEMIMFIKERFPNYS